MPVLNSQVVGNAYPTGSTGAILQNVYNTRGGWFSVLGATAFVRLQYGPHGAEHWTDEVLLGNGAFVVLPDKCTGVQFRNGVTNLVATVTAQIAQGDEPPLGVSAIGSVTLSVASLNFQRNDVAVATEPTVDFMDAAGVLTWAVVDDAANTRVKVTPSFPTTVIFPANWTNGPANANPGGGAVAGLFADSTGHLSSVAAATGTGAFGVSITTDTGVGFTPMRWYVDHAGIMNWGPGGGASTDTSLARSAAVPPSSGQVGLVTQQAFYSTNTAGGFVYAAAQNNAAFLSFQAAADAQPMFKIFTQGAMVWGAGGVSGPDIELARIVNSPSGSGSFLEVISGNGFGYGTGTGGVSTVAAASTTLNKCNGQVNFTGQANTASVPKSFIVTDSTVGANDTVIVSMNNNTTAVGTFVVSTVVTSGSFTIVCFSNTANASATFGFNFAVIKAATA